MIASLFKRSLFISALGHLAVFGIFVFSFGNKIPMADYSSISFRGAILNRFDLAARHNFKPWGVKNLLMRRGYTLPLDKSKENISSGASYYLKPSIKLTSDKDKVVFTDRSILAVSPPKKRKESVIMFYPALPYNFLLYFKDRQIVHIELMFSINSSDRANSVIIKRKISSGNLEADLLSMRYISHYLFIQQMRFPSGNWQTVKIELTPKND